MLINWGEDTIARIAASRDDCTASQFWSRR
jgi:hypothetical protein